MYFPTNNHYFDDSCNSQNCMNFVGNNDCLICLEINDNSDKNCIRIQNQLYTKHCSCDGWVHEYCLDIWYVKNKKCPICLSTMNKNQLNEVNIIIIHEEPRSWFFNGNKFCLMLKFFFSLILFYYLFLMLSSITLKILER
jgi:hypothetical protein